MLPTFPWRETTSCHIYNAIAFALFYRVFPTESMHLKGEKCSGCKNSKIRLTGLAAANIRGQKVPMFVIGNSKKPCCFKEIRRTPYRYRAQK